MMVQSSPYDMRCCYNNANSVEKGPAVAAKYGVYEYVHEGIVNKEFNSTTVACARRRGKLA
jgi:hypothetical protein